MSETSLLLLQLADTIRTLPSLMREFSDVGLRRAAAKPARAVETFSAIGHLCHLRDIEIDGYHVRLRRLRDEQNPRLISLDSEQLAAERGYDTASSESALAEFVAARETSLAALRAVGSNEWARGGDFDGYGPVTLLGMVEIMVEHDAGHLQAIRDLPRS
jgi:DinB superfamily